MDGVPVVIVRVVLLGTFKSCNNFRYFPNKLLNLFIIIVLIVRTAFLNRGEYNVFIADWGEGAGTPNYVLGE